MKSSKESYENEIRYYESSSFGYFIFIVTFCFFLFFGFFFLLTFFISKVLQ